MIRLKDYYILNPTEKGNEFEFYTGSVLIKDGKIETILKGRGHEVSRSYDDYTTIDGRFRHIIFPGFIQAHIHFCQTLHRNLAEEMPLIQWLKEEIWPYEGQLTTETMKQSVVMALKEIVSSGTTAVLDMGTVNHQDVIFEIMKTVGFRYTGGKAMMDQCDGSPPGLVETTSDSIDASMKLVETYHRKAPDNGLLQYAFAPRFVLSCSTDLLREVRKLSDHYGLLIHTHASEHPEEVAYIKETTGYGNVAYLDSIGALNRHHVIAHMVHLDEAEMRLVKKYNLSVAHCPTTNLKLGSGIAPVAEYLRENVWVGLGCDGAPCNNSLSILNELKLAPLLQKGVSNDPLRVTPEDALRLISINGAKIIRQENRVGRIQKDMDADLVLLDMDTPQTYNFEKNPAAALVYGADARNVAGTMVKGKFLYRNGKFSKKIENLVSTPAF